MSTIIAFGNPVYDEIITPAISTHGRVLSGCSTNGCLVLSGFHHHTMLIGNVGRDYYEQFVADAERYGMNHTMHISAATGGFRLVYDQRGDRTLDVLGDAGPIRSVPAICAEADAIIIGPILQETSTELIERIYAMSNAPLFLDPQGLLRRLTPGGRIEHEKHPEFARIAPLCTVIKANEVEARVITGINPREDASATVRELRSFGCAIAIVTLAESGSIIDDGQSQYVIPAYPTDARDPTGAGDTYMAGFIYAYLQDTHNLYAAGCTGSATASIWIEHTGPDAPMSIEEVMRRTNTLLRQRVG